MSNEPKCRLGNLYISSTDGFVRSVELVSDTHLTCRIEAAIYTTVKMYCGSKPIEVTKNGKVLEDNYFDQPNNMLTIQRKDIVSVEVLLN